MPTQKISREELLLKSISTFREKGYYRTSMKDLAEACNLTKGAFYHHFPSKEEVMKNCLIFSCNWFKENVYTIAYLPELTAKEKMVKMSKKLLKAFSTGNGGCFFANTVIETSHVEDTFKGILKDYFLEWESAMVHILHSKYPAEEARKLGKRTIVDIEGSIVLMQLHGDIQYLQDSIDRCLELC